MNRAHPYPRLLTERIRMGSFEFTGNVVRFVVTDDGKKLVIGYPDEPKESFGLAYHEACTLFKLLQGQFSAAAREMAGKPPVVQDRVSATVQGEVSSAAQSGISAAVQSGISAGVQSEGSAAVQGEGSAAVQGESSAGPTGPIRPSLGLIESAGTSVVSYVDTYAETQVVGAGSSKRTISKQAHGRGLVTREVVEDGALVDKGVVEQIVAHHGSVQASIRAMPARVGSSMNRRPNAEPPQRGAPAMRTVPAARTAPPMHQVPLRQRQVARPIKKAPQPVRPAFTPSYDRQTKGK